MQRALIIIFLSLTFIGCSKYTKAAEEEYLQSKELKPLKYPKGVVGIEASMKYKIPEKN